MKATAKAHSNIALVKYWGKGDEKLRLPVNSSAAITLDAIFTTTTVEFSDQYAKDTIEIDGDSFSAEENARVVEHLDRVRALAKIQTKAKVITKNNFPKGVGAASSASGFAALSVAAAKAAGLNLSEKELSMLAREGSGSASRSIPGGFTVWNKGESSETSFAERIPHPEEWDIAVLLVFVGELNQKKVGSTEGMRLASTSPYFIEAVTQAQKNIERLHTALDTANWNLLGQVTEDECYRLHTICMTSTPNILYWRGTTVDIFQTLYTLREKNIHAFFTVDAGPHVHVVCKKEDVATIKAEIQKLQDITDIVECGVGESARLLEEHLF